MLGRSNTHIEIPIIDKSIYYKPSRMGEHAAVNRSVDSSSLPGAAKSKQFELVHCKAYIWNFNSN